MARTRSIPLEKWTIDALEARFHLEQVQEHPALAAWLSAEPTLSKQEREFLEQQRQRLAENVNFWNEEELKMQFIAQVLALVEFSQKHYRMFFERTLTATVQDIVLSAKTDMVIATGKSEPQQPFFFLHEYKRERGSDNDPLAQVLLAMIIAYEKNEHKRPIYGCYVIGRNWFFVVLDDNQYAVSLEYSAVQEDLLQIVGILQTMKRIIERSFDA